MCSHNLSLSLAVNHANQDNSFYLDSKNVEIKPSALSYLSPRNPGYQSAISYIPCEIVH